MKVVAFFAITLAGHQVPSNQESGILSTQMGTNCQHNDGECGFFDWMTGNCQRSQRCCGGGCQSPPCCGRGDSSISLVNNSKNVSFNFGGQPCNQNIMKHMCDRGGQSLSHVDLCNNRQQQGAINMIVGEHDQGYMPQHQQGSTQGQNQQCQNQSDQQCPQYPEQPEQPEQPEEPQQPEEPEEPKEPQQPEEPEQPQQPEEPEQAEQQESPQTQAQLACKACAEIEVAITDNDIDLMHESFGIPTMKLMEIIKEDCKPLH